MPRQKKLPIDDAPPTEITREGQIYVDQDTYLQSMGKAAYTKTQLAAARRSGLPHITEKYGGRAVFFYNIQRCQAYHAGEDI